MRDLAIVALSATLAVGCISARDAVPMSQQYSLDLATSAKYPEGSLFVEDQAAISNESVQALLSGRIALPEQAKIAVIHLDGFRGRNWWSFDATQDTKSTDAMLETLQSARRVRVAMSVPSLMLGEKRGISSLRATAARCQADLLLVYASGMDCNRRSQLFKPDEIRGQTRAEAVLLDVRTGTVPASASASDLFEFSTDSGTFDAKFREAVEQSRTRVLSEIARKLVQFLDEAP